MATAHVQTKTGFVGSATSVNVSLTGVGAGNHLSTYSVGFGTAIPTVPTSSPSATWQAGIANFSESDNNDRGRVDYSENVASGSWTVTINGASGALTGVVNESSGVATSSSKGLTSTGSHDTAALLSVQASGSITPTAGSILYSYVSDSASGTTADTVNNAFTVSSDPAGGTNTCWDRASFEVGGSAYKNAVAASAINPQWTAPGNGAMIASIIEFLAAAAGTGLPPGLGPAQHMQPMQTQLIGW
jgi:hypothetical protein